MPIRRATRLKKMLHHRPKWLINYRVGNYFVFFLQSGINPMQNPVRHRTSGHCTLCLWSAYLSSNAAEGTSIAQCVSNLCCRRGREVPASTPPLQSLEFTLERWISDSDLMQRLAFRCGHRFEVRSNALWLRPILSEAGPDSPRPWFLVRHPW
jgi:hypothetical protein